MIRYEPPGRWIEYDHRAIARELAEAKASVLSLKTMPYQRSWVEALQKMELKMEVAGTSRIEGADFTEKELDAALKETPDQLVTRSQRQVFAALQTYEWIRSLPDDRPVTADLVREIHRYIVTGADDDHCPPGELRQRDQNVNFGTPRHRGCEGGDACREALDLLAESIRSQYNDHDPLVAALAAHYHLAAMHPFLDGNGRTARVLEALMLQRAGLRDTCFIAMSNYYYDEKPRYLAALAEVQSRGHDLTPFLSFGLSGITRQVQRLLVEIQHEMKKALFQNVMVSLFDRMATKRRRVMAKRQLAVLQLLLAEKDPLPLVDLRSKAAHLYAGLRKPDHGLIRDLNNLVWLRAIRTYKQGDGSLCLGVRLEWPTEITEKAFFQRIKTLPGAKAPLFLE